MRTRGGIGTVVGVTTHLGPLPEGLRPELEEEARVLASTLGGPTRALLEAEATTGLTQEAPDWLRALESAVLAELRRRRPEEVAALTPFRAAVLKEPADHYASERADDSWLSSRNVRALTVLWGTPVAGVFRVPEVVASTWFLPTEGVHAEETRANELEVAKRLYDDASGSLYECLVMAEALEA